jgi:hypothetical protein
MTSYVLPHIDDYRAVSRRGSGGNLGGIRYQIEDGVNGFLVSSKRFQNCCGISRLSGSSLGTILPSRSCVAPFYAEVDGGSAATQTGKLQTGSN